MQKHPHDRIIFWLGVSGFVLYAVAPIALPHALLRQPELLPVYTTMMGLGSLRRRKDDDKDK